MAHPVSYLGAALSAAAALSWPLWQGELPSNLGEWPLNIAVMAFVVIVGRLFVAALKAKDDAMKAKDDAFTAALKESQDNHAESVKQFAETLVKVQLDGHSHGEAIRRSLDGLSRAIARIKPPAKRRR
jgi:hypothetical protein